MRLQLLLCDSGQALVERAVEDASFPGLLRFDELEHVHAVKAGVRHHELERGEERGREKRARHLEGGALVARDHVADSIRDDTASWREPGHASFQAAASARI